MLSSGVLDPICSDHCPVFVIINDNIIKTNTIFRRTVYDYKSMDIENVKRLLGEIDESEVLSSDDIDSAVKILTEKLKHILNITTPHREVNIRSKDPLWMTCEIRSAMRKRNRFHKVAKNRNRPSDWANFRKLRNKVINLIRASKRNHDSKIDDNINSSMGTKTWWRMVKRYVQRKCGTISFPPIISNGTIHENPEDIANIFNEYFVSQATVNNPDAPYPECQFPLSPDTLNILHLSTSEVQDILLSLDPTKSTGPDGYW